jgi:hypothetical protein
MSSGIDMCFVLDLYLRLAQQVLTRVLEEAGYSKDSFLVLSDFVKVLSFISGNY